MMKGKVLILGVALFMGGAAPAFSAYVPVQSITDWNGQIVSPTLMRDGVDESAGYVYFRSYNVLEGAVPPNTTAGAVRVVYNCNVARQNILTVYYADTSGESFYFSSTAGVTTTTYLPLGYVNKFLRSNEPTINWAMPTAGINDYCYVYELQLYTPYNPYDTLISTQGIAALLDSATFQTTISSIAVVSEIGDFLTFQNFAGGVHSWIWGAIFMLIFLHGFATGVRLSL